MSLFGQECIQVFERSLTFKTKKCSGSCEIHVTSIWGVDFQRHPYSCVEESSVTEAPPVFFV